MSDTSPIREETPNLQPTIDISPSSTQEETTLEGHSGEQEIDLNELFPDSETNLNDLFPDTEVKHLLQKIIKNKKDMNSIKERLTKENKTFDGEDKAEDLTGDLSSANKSGDIKID